MKPLKISLAAARVNAELTQENVANELNVSKNTIISWEKGDSEPKKSQADLLSALYDMPLDYIFFGKKSH